MKEERRKICFNLLQQDFFDAELTPEQRVHLNVLFDNISGIAASPKVRGEGEV